MQGDRSLKIGIDHSNQPICCSEHVADTALRERYLGYMRDIAKTWLDWKKIGPLVAEWQSVIAADVKADTRKIFPTNAFLKAVTEDGIEPGFGPTAPPHLSLKSFVEKRRAYLLNYPGIKRPAE